MASDMPGSISGSCTGQQCAFVPVTEAAELLFCKICFYEIGFFSVKYDHNTCLHRCDEIICIKSLVPSGNFIKHSDY